MEKFLLQNMMGPGPLPRAALVGTVLQLNVVAEDTQMALALICVGDGSGSGDDEDCFSAADQKLVRFSCSGLASAARCPAHAHHQSPSP